jgi:serine phosphatase RsbU (regulator of sigma subunit)
MLDGLLLDHLRGRRLVALVALGVVAEAAVLLISHALGSSQLVGIHGVLAISLAIAIGIAGGAMAGAFVGGLGGVLFVALISSDQRHEPWLEGVAVVLLWCALPAVAGAAATSLRRAAARARSLAAEATTRAQALHRAVARLAVATTPYEVARAVVDEGAAALGAEGAWLALVNQRGGVLDYAASTGFADGWVDRFQSIPLDMPTAAADVTRDGRARFFEDADAMSRAYPANAARYRETDVQATAVLPLTRDALPIGMMALHWQRPHAFTQADRELAQAFADTAAQALDRARLYAEVRGTAETLQRSLLPTFLPTFPEYEIAVRYRPASESLAVGGDWYDVVAAHREQVGVAVGDVGGKGVEAAAVMGRLRTAMRAYAIEHAAPSEVLRRLVAYHAVTRPDVFATVVYAALDRRQRWLRIASLGHPLPLLIRDGRQIELSAEADPPLGADAPRAFRELAVPVTEGDVLLFVTDGVFERPGASSDANLQQLAAHAACHRALPVEDLAEQLVGSINDDASARDDRVLVVVRVPERVAGRHPSEAAHQVDDAAAPDAVASLVDDASGVLDPSASGSSGDGGAGPGRSSARWCASAASARTSAAMIRATTEIRWEDALALHAQAGQLQRRASQILHGVQHGRSRRRRDGVANADGCAASERTGVLARTHGTGGQEG